MRKSTKAGLLYGVTPPSTKRKVFFPSFTVSGGKYTGAAVLARTSCHRGSRRLESSRARSLYFAPGLFDTGQGESVVAFRITTISSVVSLSLPSVVSAPKTSWSIAARRSSSYLYRKRWIRLALSNMVLPLSL